jgi:O-antigen/teichoic acid export membrane protein
MTGLIPQLILGLLGLYKIKLFIQQLGIEYNGLIQLFAQLFAYFNLVESSIEASVKFRLFKLLVLKEAQAINRLLKGAKIFFNRVAYSVVLISIGMSFKLDLFIKNSPFQTTQIQILFLLYVINTVIPYFFIGDRVLLSSDQKLYRINTIYNVSLIIRTLTEIVYLMMGKDIYVFVTISIGFTLVSNLILKWVVHREYRWYQTRHALADFSFKDDMKHLIPQKIMDVVAKNTDLIIISAFLGIRFTSIYGIYNYILGFVSQSVNQVGSALYSVVGNFNASESLSKIKALFDEYLFMTIFLANLLCIPIFFTINGFIRLWVGEAMLIDTQTVILFIIILYYTIIVMPIGTFISVNGLFKDVKISTGLEMGLNVSLSILLVQWIGIKGVLVGTIISILLSSFMYSPYVLYKKLFKSSLKDYFKKFVLSLCISAVLILVISQLPIPTLYTSFFEWFLIGVGVFAMNLTLLVFLSSLLFRTELNMVLRRFKLSSRKVVS